MLWCTEDSPKLEFNIRYDLDRKCVGESHVQILYINFQTNLKIAVGSFAFSYPFSLSLSGFYHTNTRSKSIVSVRCVRRISIWNVDKPQVATKQEIQCEKRETTNTNTQSTNINQSQSSMMQKRKKQKRNFSRSIIFIYPHWIHYDGCASSSTSEPTIRTSSKRILTFCISFVAITLCARHILIACTAIYRTSA